MKRIALVCMLSVPGVAAAQEAPRGEVPFAGPYAGLEAGLHEHRFRLELSDGEGRTVGDTFRRTGFGAGAFAGYDLAVARNLRLGAEVSGHVGGGRGGRAEVAGLRFSLKPRWGVTAMARAGYVIGDRVMVYGTAGYGGYHYRLRTDIFVENADEWSDGFAYGGGVEYRIGRNVGLRADVRNLDGQATQFLLGVPIRF